MRIAQIAPLYESVPPKKYGGTERIVSYLTEELIEQGHEVTLFAAGDSQTKAELVAVCREGLRLNKNCIDPLAHHIVQLQIIMERANEFDILHFHNDYLHFPLSKRLGHPNVTTLHGRLDLPDLPLLYRKFNDLPLVSISDSQRLPIPFAHWMTTIYHGLPMDLYRQGEGKGNYLAFIGRISSEKRVDRAIEIAKRVGIPLRIAAKIDKADEEYFEKYIRHLLDDPVVEYIGEIGEDEKGEFLGDALAMLFPIDWPEPFGLVMIESMACGTPVIAYKKGSVQEIVDEGITGFTVSSLDDAISAVKKLHWISRTECRKMFEERFSASLMVRNYVEVYQQLIRENKGNKSKRFQQVSAC